MRISLNNTYFATYLKYLVQEPAGGMGAAVIAVLKGGLRRGIEIVLDYTNFDKHIEGADLIITGEGRIDEQTAYGKAPVGVAERAKHFHIPVIAIGDRYLRIIRLFMKRN